MSLKHEGGIHLKNTFESLYPVLYAPTLDEELLPSLGLALSGVFGANVLVWLLTLLFAPL
jgi:hypothetical protein